MLFLLLGLAATLGVAVAGFTVPLYSSAGSTDSELPPQWLHPVPPDWPPAGSGVMLRTRFATYRRVESADRVPPPTPGLPGRRACTMIDCRIGWPLRALGMYATSDSRPGTTAGAPGRTVDVIYGTITLPARLQASAAATWLPTRPIALGLIADSSLYGAAAWAALAAAMALKHARRRRRGLCWRCAYPVGLSPVCTECGATVAEPKETSP